MRATTLNIDKPYILYRRRAMGLRSAQREHGGRTWTTSRSLRMWWSPVPTTSTPGTSCSRLRRDYLWHPEAFILDEIDRSRLTWPQRA